jgi:hypothetical protein
LARGRRPLLHSLLGFVDLKRELQLCDDALGELGSGVVRRMLLEQPAEQGAATGDREADREGEMVAEAAMIHGEACSCFVPQETEPDAHRRVKGRPYHLGAQYPGSG